MVGTIRPEISIGDLQTILREEQQGFTASLPPELLAVRQAVLDGQIGVFEEDQELRRLVTAIKNNVDSEIF